MKGHGEERDRGWEEGREGGRRGKEGQTLGSTWFSESKNCRLLLSRHLRQECEGDT